MRGEEREVAVKTLADGSTEEKRIQFLQEAAIMSQFKHPNVITLHGVLMEKEPVKLIPMQHAMCTVRFKQFGKFVISLSICIYCGSLPLVHGHYLCASIIPMHVIHYCWLKKGLAWFWFE